MTPASTTTQVDCGQHTLMPTGEPKSSNHGEAVDADLQSFLNELDQEDRDDLASEEPVPPARQPTRHSGRSTTRHNYKALHTGKESKKLAMVTIPSERQTLPTVLTLSTIKAVDYQRDRNGRDQRQVPKSYWDARKGAKWEDWKPAFEKQIRDLESRNTWDLIYPPPDANILPGKWVLDMKFNAKGEWDRNRARWVVCGNFENAENWAAQDVYAAVANSASVK